jgi:hypothetical protein
MIFYVDIVEFREKSENMCFHENEFPSCGPKIFRLACRRTEAGLWIN